MKSSFRVRQVDYDDDGMMCARHYPMFVDVYHTFSYRDVAKVRWQSLERLDLLVLLLGTG